MVSNEVGSLLDDANTLAYIYARTKNEIFLKKEADACFDQGPPGWGCLLQKTIKKRGAAPLFFSKYRDQTSNSPEFPHNILFHHPNLRYL
jgi:hypothetical protein